MRRGELAETIKVAELVLSPECHRMVHWDGKRRLMVVLEPGEVQELVEAARALLDLRGRMDKTLRPCG